MQDLKFETTGDHNSVNNYPYKPASGILLLLSNIFV